MQCIFESALLFAICKYASSYFEIFEMAFKIISHGRNFPFK